MNIIAIVISFASLIVAVISLVRSSKSQQLQDQVNELDYRLKKCELEQKEEEKRPRTCIETRVYNISKGKYRIKVYNSGNTMAYNISVHIDEDARIIIIDQDKMPYEVLEPDDSFELNLITTMGSARKFNVTVDWEDEDGNRLQKTQLRDR